MNKPGGAAGARLEDRKPKGRKPKGHPDVAHGGIGVLLVNLGTPDATDYWSMRRYLKEFLSDRRVVEANRLVWWLVLNGIILTTRPKRSGHAYAKIWNKEKDESPLRTVTREQARLVAERLAQNPAIRVDWAMRYGNPSMTSVLARLKQEGCERILVFPLYPQYSAATTATVNDKAFEALARMRWQPSLRTVPPYYDDPVYIDALAKSLQQGLGRLAFKPEAVLASFHGLPRSYFAKGDPYYCHCAKTTRLLRAALGWPEEKLKMTFQSRFGREEWLKPYTDATVERLAREGVRSLAVITPGFVSDCVETLEEIAMQNAEIFRRHGGANFALIPCLNASEPGIDVIEHAVRRELSGWA
ncbi:MAG: ferrochelatase [Hyphomicrobiales bacterium]|nr:ferrochelatase [Hyphomicrobiales bacterium]